MMGQNYFDKKDILRSKLIFRYVDAMDQGDIDAVSSVLDEALVDPELDRIITEINLNYLEEIETTAIDADAQVVKRLIAQHLPSASGDKSNTQPSLTVGDVAARLQADRSVSSTDEELNLRLIGNSTSLPEMLSMKAIRQLARELGVPASERFWRTFKSTATKLAMAHNHNQVQFVAAREQRATYMVDSDETQRASDIEVPESGGGE